MMILTNWSQLLYLNRTVSFGIFPSKRGSFNKVINKVCCS
jgi:hypothetical protein